MLPFINRSLESPAVTVQEMTLSVVPSLMGAVDFVTMKNQIIPRIQVCTQDK